MILCRSASSHYFVKHRVLTLISEILYHRNYHCCCYYYRSDEEGRIKPAAAAQPVPEGRGSTVREEEWGHGGGGAPGLDPWPQASCFLHHAELGPHERHAAQVVHRGGDRLLHVSDCGGSGGRMGRRGGGEFYWSFLHSAHNFSKINTVQYNSTVLSPWENVNIPYMKGTRLPRLNILWAWSWLKEYDLR